MEETFEDSYEDSDSETEQQESPSEGRKMYEIKCSNCGKTAEVPFEPEEGRDVYCNECYRQKRPRSSFGRDRGYSGGGFKRRSFKITCANCGKEDSVPFKPREDSSVLCRECFAKKKTQEE